MENKKIDVLFGITVIAFLVVTMILIKEFKAKRVNDFKEYTATLTNIVRLKNDKIKVLFNQLLAKQRENEDLKNTLTETRNDLEVLSKKLTQAQVPVALPAAAAK